MQNRLARIDKYSGYQTVSESVEYRYNTAGIRIQKTEDPDGTPIVTDYLIDPYNHTGYAQVLQETVDDGSSDWTRIQYTIGDDVLAQTSLTSADSGANWTTGDTQYLLYDGHGSTRQLVSDTGAVQDSYSYDGYGVMLGDSTTPNPAKTADTSLLYSGEQYDGNLDQYYLRARYYNQNNGTFNRVDPYSGNMQDPQSLHKYAYVHNNPVNMIDPTGLWGDYSLHSLSIAGVIVATIGALTAGAGIVTKNEVMRGIGIALFTVGLFMVAAGFGLAAMSGGGSIIAALSIESIGTTAIIGILEAMLVYYGSKAAGKVIDIGYTRDFKNFLGAYSKADASSDITSKERKIPKAGEIIIRGGGDIPVDLGIPDFTSNRPQVYSGDTVWKYELNQEERTYGDYDLQVFEINAEEVNGYKVIYENKLDTGLTNKHVDFNVGYGYLDVQNK